MNRLVIAFMSGILFFYFLLKPEVDSTTSYTIFAFWVISMMYDLRFTLANGSLIPRYEQSVLLVFVHYRMPKIHAILVVILAESACVMLLPALLLFEINFGCSVAIACFFVMLHAVAIYHNDAFARRLG